LSQKTQFSFDQITIFLKKLQSQNVIMILNITI